MERICKTLHDLRTIHRFNGYIHCKSNIAEHGLNEFEEAGWYADRMSVNLGTCRLQKDCKKLAPDKSKNAAILTPMRQKFKMVWKKADWL